MESEEFKAIQDKLGWTNEHLSRQLGVSLNTTNSWRSGRNRITGTTSLLMRLLLWLKESGTDNPVIEV